MLYEITAAIDQLCTLLHPSIDSTRFRAQLLSSLTTRFAPIWFCEDSDRASASRAILWHAHGGGEGRDDGLLQACLNVSEEGGSLDFFSHSFTLWIDPGCVAIRLGNGPGVYLPSSTPTGSTAVKTIYGQRQTQHQQQTQRAILPTPVLTLSPSTPALGSNHGAWSSFSQHVQPRHSLASFYTHARSTSSSSVASSNTGSRSSYTSSADDSDHCPSLTDYSPQDSESDLSIEDMIDSGCYKNFDIIDDDDIELGHCGDDTITDEFEDAGDVTISAHEKTPAAIINYDGGNVGVLGGGIRLGGAMSSSSGTRSQTVSSSTIATQRGGQYAPPLPPPNSSQQFEQSTGFSLQYNMIDGYAIPMSAKRVRSRGRRSRGRGAGRAARRQAAAATLQSLTEASEQHNSSSVMPLAHEKHQSSTLEGGSDDGHIMAIVRQRADQVAKDMIRRHLAATERQLQHTPYTHYERQEYHYPQQAPPQQQQQQQQHHYQRQQFQSQYASHSMQLQPISPF
ncbi:hypothetical protein CBS101457_004704 [Exobasidium rhododendri]|nr:hypothetical protein CBS101457_004704 [Exobasidium rhododendri]